MKKGIFVSSLIVSFLFIFLFIFYYNPQQNLQFSPPSMQNYTTNDYSDENITALWDSIFKIDSSNLTILKNSSSNEIFSFLAYKNISSKFYILEFSSSDVFTPFYLSKETSATIVNVSDSSTLLERLQANYSLTPINLILFEIISSDLDTSLIKRNLTLSEAEIEYYNELKPIMPALSEEGMRMNRSEVIFTTSNSTNSTNGLNLTTYSYYSGVNANSSFLYFGYSEIYLTQLPQCNSTWVAINTSCMSDDTLTTWFNDTNSCNNFTNMPSNITSNCDFNGNGFIGDENAVSESNLDLIIKINSTRYNSTNQYTGYKIVEFLDEDNITRVRFNHSFVSPLDLKKITVKMQPGSSRFGYLIVNGLSANKTLRIDKKNSTTDSICVKQSEIYSISSISSSCSSTNESLIDCPGSEGSIRCDISGNYFVVSGLRNSAVQEYISSSSSVSTSVSTTTTVSTTCTTNWTCSSWGSCSSLGTRTRTCTDRNNCSILSGKPAESETCLNAVPSSCTTNWTCTEWGSCSSFGNRTRTCTDRNNCNVLTAKPEVLQTCEYGEPIGPITYIIVALIILAIVVMGIIAVIIFRGGKEDSRRSPISDTRPSPPANTNFLINQGNP
jgi:hypothetical protein